MANPTNPNRVVRVKDLNRFKGNTDGLYATQAGLEGLATAIGMDEETDVWVDLGLPSGTLWAKYNVGALTETDYGNYYKYGAGAVQYDGTLNKYTGTENPLDPTKDTATVVWGAPWHMPTKEQFEELVANTTYTYESDFDGSGVNGGKFTAANGKYIFLPAGGEWANNFHSEFNNKGFYWSSTPNSDYPSFLHFTSSGHGVAGTARSNGELIRPVRNSRPQKADRVDNPTQGNLAGLDAQGNPTDSGYSPGSFSEAGHNHDDRYYTETETDNKLSTKSNISHNHDTKYATKEELNNATVSALVADAFLFAVDRQTMKLHAYSANSFALNFYMEDGYIKASSPSE